MVCCIWRKRSGVAVSRYITPLGERFMSRRSIALGTLVIGVALAIAAGWIQYAWVPSARAVPTPGELPVEVGIGGGCAEGYSCTTVHTWVCCLDSSDCRCAEEDFCLGKHVSFGPFAAARWATTGLCTRPTHERYICCDTRTCSEPPCNATGCEACGCVQDGFVYSSTVSRVITNGEPCDGKFVSRQAGHDRLAFLETGLGSCGTSY